MRESWLNNNLNLQPVMNLLLKNWVLILLSNSSSIFELSELILLKKNDHVCVFHDSSLNVKNKLLYQ